MKHYAYESPFKMKDKEGVEYDLEIAVDEWCDNPRDFDNNLCTMVCWHNRYNLGDKHDFDKPSDFWDWVEENGGKENFCIVSLNLYDHSGLTISTSSGYPYNDCWDAGCVGFAYISKRDVLEEFFVTEETWRKRAEEIIDGEVEIYDMYLRGDVYGFRLTKKVVEQDKCIHCGEIIREYEVDEYVNSCFGFYGDCLEENGILDDLGDLEFMED